VLTEVSKREELIFPEITTEQNLSIYYLKIKDGIIFLNDSCFKDVFITENKLNGVLSLPNLLHFKNLHNDSRFD